MANWRSGVPRTTHTWLKNLYDYLDKEAVGIYPSGASGIPNASWLGSRVPYTMVGNQTGTIGFYGATGVVQVASGTAGISGMTGSLLGASGPAVWWFNGGSGAYYTIGDAILALKNLGALKA